MPISITARALAFTALLFGANLGGQVPAEAADQLAVERAVLTHLVGRIPTHNAQLGEVDYAGWAFDPRLQERRDVLAWRPSTAPIRTPLESRTLASILGTGLLLPNEDACPGLDCRMKGFRGVISFTRALVEGDTAQIDTHAHYQSRVRPGTVNSEIVRWRLVRVGAEWRVIRRDHVVVT